MITPTTVKIFSLSDVALDDLLNLLMYNEKIPLSEPKSVICLNKNSEDLLEYSVTWDEEPLRISVSLSEIFRSERFPEEIDPNISIEDGTGFASRFLREVVESSRLKESLSRQIKRTNALTTEILTLKKNNSNIEYLIIDLFNNQASLVNTINNLSRELLQDAPILQFTKH